MKTIKLLKILTILMLLSVFLILTACHTNTGPISSNGESEESEQVKSTGELEQNDPTEELDGEGPSGEFGYKLSSVVQAMAITEKGYYYIANGILRFYDIANDISIPMCSRTECSHSGSSCDAYANKINASGSDVSCICDGYEFFYYDDKLYMVECDKESRLYLCQYSSSFSDKTIITQLAAGEDDMTTAELAGGYTIYDGYFYYYMHSYNPEESFKGDYMVEMNCMRVKLTKGATPEKLGSFAFPGDYIFGAGDSSGTAVLICGDAVYYVAGHYMRAWSKKDEMQYRVAKYSVSTKEFEILCSYTGDVDDDAWGKGLGPIVCEGNNVCMAESGTMYAITGECSIASINFETGERKIIYTSPYKDPYGIVKHLAYDGTYLYFMEREGGVATYLTAIDTEGNLIRRYEFEFSDVYKKDLAKYKREVGRVSGEINLLGVSDGNILVVSTADVYKNLTSRLGIYTLKQDYGVGMISTSDFLENKDIEIKQIYQFGY